MGDLHLGADSGRRDRLGLRYGSPGRRSGNNRTREATRQEKLKMYLFPFLETGTKAHFSWLTSESLLVPLIPSAGSCMPPASPQHLTCTSDWDLALVKAMHMFAANMTTSGCI